MKFTSEDLTSTAKGLVRRIDFGNSGSDAGTVAAALESSSGHIHTGICIHLACGIGACAEYSAVADMLKHRETKIAQIVAVNAKRILAPCGRCRELMFQISPSNAKTKVIIGKSEFVLLEDLLPYHWLERE